LLLKVDWINQQSTMYIVFKIENYTYILLITYICDLKLLPFFYRIQDTLRGYWFYTERRCWTK